MMRQPPMYTVMDNSFPTRRAADLMVWGNNSTAIRPSYANESFTFAWLYMPKAQVYGGIVAVLVLVALGFMLSKTWLGRAIRAAAVNPSGAEQIGRAHV